MPGTADPCVCRHCGTRFAEGAGVDGFCCAGCAYVHRLISQEGLDKFYDLRDRPLAPVAPASLQPRAWDWLRDAAQAAEAAAGGEVVQMELSLQGATCVGCVWLLERLFTEQPGGLRLEVNVPRGRVRLAWSKGAFDAVGFAGTVQRFGYLLGPAREETAADPESRGLLDRVGLCAAFAMNAMGFSLPRYLGMADSFFLAGLFDLLTLLFATLALLIGGGYFLGRAVAAARRGVLHIDIPIALGLLVAYAGSLGGWLTGESRLLYFDFVATFSFLMLLGRWLQESALERNRRRLARAGPDALEVRPDPGDGSGPEAWPRASPARLTAGTVFAVGGGQTVPVCARVEEPEVSASLEWITGEAEARTYRRGALVPAGAVHLGRGPARFRATEGWSDSLLARLLQAPSDTLFRNPLLERVLRLYTAAVVGLALAALLLWGVVAEDWRNGLQAAMSILVVSCPCALGVALPLAGELAVGRLRREGLFVRDESIWARLDRVRHLVFDKTGTLTLEAPVLRRAEALTRLDPVARARLWRMVEGGFHPVSRCLRAALLADPAAQPGDAGDGPPPLETVGAGVSLATPEGEYRLGRPAWAEGRSDAASAPGGSPAEEEAEEAVDVAFCRDGTVLAHFSLVESARPGLAADLAALRVRGLDLTILSGDRPAKVEALTRLLGLPAEAGHAGLTPAQKAAWLRAHAPGRALYVGDGANDSLAFEEAVCRGTPVADQSFLESKADFYYLGRGLGALRRLFEVADHRRRTARAVFLFAALYNAGAIGLCAAGRMHPLLATILMPSSAILTVAFVAWRLGRPAGRDPGSP